MSDLTMCNKCSLVWLRKQAKKEKQLVRIIPSKRSLGLGGVDVYIVPRDIAFAPENEEFHKKYFNAWFMEVGQYCSCGRNC